VWGGVRSRYVATMHSRTIRASMLKSLELMQVIGQGILCERGSVEGSVSE
jgi:hypothetical protein